MLYATAMNGEKVKATKTLRRATCPTCGEEVLAKTGEINMWHWAHASTSECDPWSEGETEWHLRWKACFPKENVEVVIRKNNTVHRADVLVGRLVIELQHSRISTEMIRSREEFYGNMIWLFDCVGYSNYTFDGGYVPPKIDLRGGSSAYRTFRWRHPIKSLAYAMKPVYLDLYSSDFVFRLGKLYVEDGPPYGGFGWIESFSKVVQRGS